MSCLDENSVIEFIQGLLSPEEAARIEEHVDSCPACRELMGEVAKLSIASSRGRPGSAGGGGAGAGSGAGGGVATGGGSGGGASSVGGRKAT